MSFQYESSGDADEHDEDYEDEFDEDSGGKTVRVKKCYKKYANEIIINAA